MVSSGSQNVTHVPETCPRPRFRADDRPPFSLRKSLARRGERRAPSGNHLCRGVRRAVVDEDDVDGVSRVRLSSQRVQEVAEVRLDVVGRHDERELRPHSDAGRDGSDLVGASGSELNERAICADATGLAFPAEPSLVVGQQVSASAPQLPCLPCRRIVRLRSPLARIRRLSARYRADGRLPPIVSTLLRETTSLRANDLVDRLLARIRPVVGANARAYRAVRRGGRRMAVAGTLTMSAQELTHDFAGRVERGVDLGGRRRLRRRSGRRASGARDL